MKRMLIALGAALALAAAAFAVVWFVPAVQDRIVKAGMAGALAKANAAPPMPDLTRSGACAAIIAGGHVVVIDSGPGSWAKLGAAGVPAAAVDTVLLTH